MFYKKFIENIIQTPNLVSEYISNLEKYLNLSEETGNLYKKNKELLEIFLINTLRFESNEK